MGAHDRFINLFPLQAKARHCPGVWTHLHNRCARHCAQQSAMLLNSAMTATPAPLQSRGGTTAAYYTRLRRGKFVHRAWKDSDGGSCGGGGAIPADGPAGPGAEPVTPLRLEPLAAAKLAEQLATLAVPATSDRCVPGPLPYPTARSCPPQQLLALARRAASTCGPAPPRAWQAAWTTELRRALRHGDTRTGAALRPAVAAALLAELLAAPQPPASATVTGLTRAVLAAPEACRTRDLLAALLAAARVALPTSLAAQHQHALPPGQQGDATAPSGTRAAVVAAALVGQQPALAVVDTAPHTRWGGATSLPPAALAAWAAELGTPRRLRRLKAEELAALLGAAAALRLPLPAGWVAGCITALQPDALLTMPPAALACLAASVPALAPTTGALGTWRSLCADITSQQATQAPAEQLCELLPLLAAVGAPIPPDWMVAALQCLQSQLHALPMGSTARALVAATALGCPPPRAWCDAWLSVLRRRLGELPRGDAPAVAAALAAADALPSLSWLRSLEEELASRAGGGVCAQELVAVGELFAALGHAPDPAWRDAWLLEVSQLVLPRLPPPALAALLGTAVHMGCQPGRGWLAVYVSQLTGQLMSLTPTELAQMVDRLQRLGAQLPAPLLSEALDVAAAAGPTAPADTALLLGALARAQYEDGERVNQLLTATAPVSTLSAGSGEESVTLLAALAAMHHRPALDWLEAFCDASVHRLEGLRGGSLAVLGAALATLHFLPSDSWVGAFLDACRARLSAGDMDAPDAATLLAALAALRVSPPEPWLHACLGVLGGTLRTLDAERLASVAVSLASLGVIIKDGPWLDAYVSMTSVRLSGMSSESRVALLRALAAFGTALPRAWVAVYQLICVRQAEAGGMTAAQIEQVLVALGSRGYPPSSALAQLYFDVSLPGLPSASPRAVAAVLQALERTAVQPDPAWLQALCDAVHAGAAGYDAVQLGTVASALAAFEQGGMRQAWLTDCSDYLRGLQP